jgi:hypothetical protein
MFPGAEPSWPWLAGRAAQFSPDQAAEQLADHLADQRPDQLVAPLWWHQGSHQPLERLWAGLAPGLMRRLAEALGGIQGLCPPRLNPLERRGRGGSPPAPIRVVPDR